MIAATLIYPFIAIAYAYDCHIDNLKSVAQQTPTAQNSSKHEDLSVHDATIFKSNFASFNKHYVKLKDECNNPSQSGDSATFFQKYYRNKASEEGKHVLAFFDKNFDSLEMDVKFKNRLAKITEAKYSEEKINEAFTL